ncbi:tetratricopeptide repeat protein [candidate division WOR-3 bacterium]|nr:tetratricopeptide repeat protein [candidate division WOR-3 bacterium]
MKRTLLVLTIVAVTVLSFTGCETSYITAGKVYLQQSNFPKAMEQFKQEIQAEPTKANGYLWAAKTYAYMQKYDSCAIFLDKAMKVDKEGAEKDLNADRGNWWLYYHDAAVQLITKDNDIDMGIKRLERAIEIQPESVKSYNILGYAYSLKKDYKKMVEAYKKAIRMNKNDLQAYVNLGQYYINVGKYNDALIYLKQAEKIDPDMAKIYYLEGVAYFGLKKSKDAIDSYKRAVDLYEKNNDKKAAKDVYFNVALTYMKMKQHKDAIPYLQKVLEVDDQDKDALMNLGICYINTKEYKKALPIFDKLIQLDPKNLDAYTNRGIVKKQLGDIKGAMKDIKKGTGL